MRRWSTRIVRMGSLRRAAAVAVLAGCAVVSAAEAAPGRGRGGVSFQRAAVPPRMPLMHPVPRRPFFAARVQHPFFAARQRQRVPFFAPFSGGAFMTGGGAYDATPAPDLPEMGPPAMAGIRAAPVGQPTVYVIERAGRLGRAGEGGVHTGPGPADPAHGAGGDSTALRVVTVRVP